MRTTFHLVPAETWADRDHDEPYTAPSLDVEEFIHCTDGSDELLATGNRHYFADDREFVALTIDLDRAGSPWRFDDPSGIYPHVYGSVAAAAILAVTTLVRDPDGRFIGFAPG